MTIQPINLGGTDFDPVKEGILVSECYKFITTGRRPATESELIYFQSSKQLMFSGMPLITFDRQNFIIVDCNGTISHTSTCVQGYFVTRHEGCEIE